MEELELKFVELHSPLFLSGTNLGVKLDPSKRTGMILSYFREDKELHVFWNKETAIIPTTNVVAMVPGKAAMHIPQHTHPIVAGISSAQVETPYGHVHAGPGHGKKGK